MGIFSKLALKLLKLRQLLAVGDWDEVPFDNTYPWLGWALLEATRQRLPARKPAYAFGVVQGAALARVLGIERITAIEFGVAGGAGLLALEDCAAFAEKQTGVTIDVVGFDTGVGLPKPEDYRDQPNMWFEGQLPMNRDLLESRLRRASLRIGPVKETAPAFLASKPAPIGFISFDMDLYTSTRDSFAVIEGDYDTLLPRVPAYFDDILGHSYNDFCGERLAMHEFNQASAVRKLSPIYGLRHFLPPMFDNQIWPECMHFAHFFEHPLYNRPDSLKKAVITDIHGRNLRVEPDSAWRAKAMSNAE